MVSFYCREPFAATLIKSGGFRPSTLSAFRLATLEEILTLMGASPLCTLRERALSLSPALLFTICMAETH
jgi:hypothetical protein